MQLLEYLLRGVASQNRLRIIRMLYEHNSLSVNEIAEALNISVKTTSYHLRRMYAIGLVEYRKNKNHVYYSLRLDQDQMMQEFLYGLRYSQEFENSCG